MKDYGVYVKNISTRSYNIVEIGNHELAAGDTVELTDPALPSHYRRFQFALRAIKELLATSLYQGVHAEPPVLEYWLAPKSEQE
jgi:hypothetical protein